MDSDMHEGGASGLPSIASRVGYRESALAEATTNHLRGVIAARMPRVLPVDDVQPAPRADASPVAAPALVSASVSDPAPAPEPAVQPGPEAAPREQHIEPEQSPEPEPAPEQSEEHEPEEREPETGHLQAAQALHDAKADAVAGDVSQDGHEVQDAASIERESGGGSSSGANASSSAAAASAAAPPPAASEENLTREDIDSSGAPDDAPDEGTEDAAEAEPVPGEAWSESAGADEGMSDPAAGSDGTPQVIQVEMQAPARRVRVLDGEPLRDARVNPKSGLRFDGSGTKQVKQFPATLDAILREDLREMTNDEFAREVSLQSMLTAFVASQLGALTTNEAIAGLDDNTRTALVAFRMMDRRTGAVEGRLAELDTRTEQMYEAMKTTLHVLKKHAEQTRFVENGVTFLVTERLEPTRMADVPLTQVQMVDGKYRQVRDRLLEQTDRELRDEKLAKGRLLR